MIGPEKTNENIEKKKGKKTMYRMFICHSSHEKLLVEGIVPRLEKQGIECWVSSLDVHPGKNFLEEVIPAINECDCFLVLLSDAACTSGWVEKEVMWAISKGKYIIPLLVGKMELSEKFAFMLQTAQMCQIGDDVETMTDKIIDLLSKCACTDV